MTLDVAAEVPCSSLTLALALSDLGHHDEADATTMFWIRRTPLANEWLDFAYKRLQFITYPEVRINSVRIRYMGNLDLPTTQTFTPP